MPIARSTTVRIAREWNAVKLALGVISMCALTAIFFMNAQGVVGRCVVIASWNEVVVVVADATRLFVTFASEQLVPSSSCLLHLYVCRAINILS